MENMITNQSHWSYVEARPVSYRKPMEIWLYILIQAWAQKKMRREKAATEQPYTLHFIWHITSIQIKTKLELAYALLLNKDYKGYFGQIVMNLSLFLASTFWPTINKDFDSQTTLP